MQKEMAAQIEEALQLIDPILWAVTSKTEKARGGLIATFVTNASIAPQCPRFLIGIAKQHHTWSLIEKSGCCALHLLREEQIKTAWKLGTSSRMQSDKLIDIQTETWNTGSPILTDAIAAFDCKVEARFDTGDRTLYLLEIVEGRQLHSGSSLKFSTLWQQANKEQKSLLDRLLKEDQQIDQAAIQNWRQ